MNDDNLVNFTDVLGDEIPNSQEPLSLPTSSEKIQIEDHTINMPETIILHDNKIHNIPRPAKGTGQYAEFRSIDEIDIKYRSVFSYPFFNLVQSSVIEDALYSNKSMVVCAPTGSGKTVVFEMAIVQLLMELEDSQRNDDFKIIYMAPVKALCTERLTEWYPKFTKLGLLCIEVTGDTDVDFSQLKPYRIIITTPEKWDMVTRRWREHSQLVEEIKLFLIDEVHILNDEARGPVLEAVVSRMKTIETSAQSAFRIEQLQKQYQGSETSSKSPPKIRFVAVSATVSNPEDVAAWLGTADSPAVYYKFGDECRPVRLKRVVEGYPCLEGTSIFKFDIILNYKLWPVIQKYHDGKPTLIFCNTRKSVALTAETLSKELTVSFSPEQKAKLVTLASTIKNKKLQMLVLSGVGCHHAGLLYEERTSIEHAFRNRDLPILITTTTLAMGVNLPAHLVIIKNTQQYVNGAYQEYSISTVLQMVGRAGRPQFDTEATAVIMTRLCDKPRYQALVGGSEPLQSYLHKRLAENLNSEAALGTVNDVAQCVQWVRSTFLSVRAARDPKRYLGLPQVAPQQLITKKLEELCVKAMNGLASSGMITMDEACCIASTEAGRLMSLYYLDLETMKLIMKINGDENLERLLWLICESHELSDMHLRMDERRILNALNRNNAAPTVRFPMKGKISTRQMKLNCVIQAVLGCLNIPDPSLNQEAMKIMRIADRICKCLVAYVTHPTFISQQPQHYSAILNALILAKCVSAHLWENSPYVSKQLRGIGPTFSTLLATAGKVNFMLLEESHPRDLERIMNKGPPAGNVLRKQISLLPKYQVTMSPIDAKSVAVQLKLLNQSYLCENMGQLTAGDAHKTYLLIGDSENNILFFSSFKDKDLISFYDGIKTHEITRKVDSEHKILVHCVSSTFVGIDAQCEYLFKDLTPGRLGTTCQTNEDFILRPAAKQTHITDTYKERKRRNNIANDISQPKEKKKRDNTIVQKFKSLRESFEKTSKEVKDDFDKSMNFSNEFLQEFTLHDKSKTVMDLGSDQLGTSKTNIETPIQCSNYLPLADITKINSTEQVDYDEKIDLDDEKINNILAEIENEMTKTKKGINLLRNTKADDIIENIDRSAIPGPSSSHTSAKNIFDYKTYDALNKTRKQFRKTNKLNHKFIDLLDKKIDLSDEEDEVVSNETTGFTNTIKSQIEKYLHKTIHDTNKSKTDIVFCNENEKSERKTIDEKHKTAYEFKNLSKYIDKAETNNENANPSKNIEKLKTNIDKANLSNNMDKTEINIENAVRDKWNIVEIVTQENFNDYRKQDTKEGNMDNWCQNQDPVNKESFIENYNDISEKDMLLYKDPTSENSLKNDKNCHRANANNINCELVPNDQLDYTIPNPNLPRKLVPFKIDNRERNRHLPNIIALPPPLHRLPIYNKILPGNAISQRQTCQNNATPMNKIGMSGTQDQLKLCITEPSHIEKSLGNNRVHKNDLPTQATLTTYNNKDARIKHYSYSTTKIDITAKNEDVTIVRKIKLDVDITEIRAQRDGFHRTRDRNEKSDKQICLNNLSVMSGKEVDVISSSQEIISVEKDNKVEEIKYSDSEISDLTIHKNNLLTIEPFQKPLGINNTHKDNERNYSSEFRSVTSTKSDQNIELVTNSVALIPFTQHNVDVIKENECKLTDTNCTNLVINAPDMETIISKKDCFVSTIADKFSSQKHTEPSIQLNQENKNIETSEDHQTDVRIYDNSNNNSLKKENYRLGSILQKYSKILRKTDSGSLSQIQSQSKVSYNNSSTLASSQKPKKPFKISEIQNYKIPLSKLQISEAVQREKNKLLPIKEKTEMRINEEQNSPTFTQEIPVECVKSPPPESNKWKTNQNCTFNEVSDDDIEDNTEEEICEVNLEEIVNDAQEQQTSDNFDIDQNMFDPKKLIECFNTDEPDMSIIIPPPLEFCDESNLTSEEENTVPLESYEPTNWDNPNESIFQDNSNIELTPEKEIETWILSQNDQGLNYTVPSNFNISRQSFTILHTPRQRSTQLQNVSVTRENISGSRQNKLGQFKFSHKKKFVPK